MLQQSWGGGRSRERELYSDGDLWRGFSEHMSGKRQAGGCPKQMVSVRSWSPRRGRGISEGLRECAAF